MGISQVRYARIRNFWIRVWGRGEGEGITFPSLRMILPPWISSRFRLEASQKQSRVNFLMSSASLGVSGFLFREEMPSATAMVVGMAAMVRRPRTMVAGDGLL